jgi:antitoxin CptB
MIGGFFDRYAATWNEAELAWFEALIDEDDVDIMAWALRTQAVPEEYRGEMMEAMQRLDYVVIGGCRALTAAQETAMPRYGELW